MTSRAADRLLASRERILARWEERVRKEIPAATGEEHPIIIDTLPAVLRQLGGDCPVPGQLGQPAQLPLDGGGGRRVRGEHEAGGPPAQDQGLLAPASMDWLGLLLIVQS